MACSIAQLPNIMGRHVGRHAKAVAICYVEPGWFSDGSNSFFIMYMDESDTSDNLKWVQAHSFYPDHRIIER